MIKPEQVQTIAHEIALKARLPIDMTTEVACARAITTNGGEEVDIIRVIVTVTDETGDSLAIRHTIENRQGLDVDTFSLWLLGYVQGAIDTLDAAESEASQELARLAGDGSMRRDH